MEQLKRGERERRREEARDTMWTEGAEVIQTSGNGENETKEGYIYICRRDNRVRSSLRAKQLFPTSSGGWMRPRFVTRICGETLASLCSLSFQATIYAQLFLDQLRYSFLPLVHRVFLSPTKLLASLRSPPFVSSAPLWNINWETRGLVTRIHSFFSVHVRVTNIEEREEWNETKW